MGWKDHRKTWMFEVRATPEQCERVFENVFNTGKAGRGLKSSKAEFTLRRVTDQDAGDHLVAVFDRLRGLGGAAFRTLDSAVSSAMESSSSAHENAKGTQIAFQARPADEAGTTRCAMWMKNYVDAMGDTYKRFMGQVEADLGSLDPAMRSTKVK